MYVSKCVKRSSVCFEGHFARCRILIVRSSLECFHISVYEIMYLYVKLRKHPTRCNNYLFINLFKSALHVSGENFAHPQERSLTVDLYTAFGIMHRHCCRPVHCTKSCIYSQNVLLRMGEFFTRNMYGWFKKINKQKSCCILLVVYIIVLMMRGHTNIKLKKIIC